MNDRPYVTTATALALALAGCAKAEDSSATDADALPSLALVEELRIGSAEDADTGFSAIGGVDVDRDGNVYVFESQAMEIRVHDRDGRLIRKIGRRGSGPGEFEGEPLFGVVGDTVWTSDLMRRRLALFDRRGGLLATAPVEEVRVNLHRPREVGYVLPTSMRDDGLMVGTVALYSMDRATDAWPVKATDTIATPRVLFNGAGRVVDTVGWDRVPPGDSPVLPRVQVGSSSYPVPQPPPAGGFSEELPDGRVAVTVPPARAGERATFTVTRLGLGGDTVYHRRMTWTPTPYRDAELDSLAWRRARRIGVTTRVNGVMMPGGASSDSTAAFNAIREAMTFPQHRQPVTGIVAHADGGVWLARGDDGAGSRRWIVIDAAGAVRGEVSAPRTNRVMWSAGDLVWMVEPDEMDVPWLARYRIR
jgi:hypothetical protein